MKKNLKLRIGMMLGGIILIGLSVGLFRIADLGVDPFTCGNLGPSIFTGIQFGTLELCVNSALLLIMLFFDRKSIHIGSFTNMVLVGYLSDFVCFLKNKLVSGTIYLPGKIGLLALSTVILCLGVAFYMDANLGIAPYDAMAPLLVKAVKNKISFRVMRILTDAGCVIIGCCFCLAKGEKITAVLGVGTIITAFFTGPLVQFFKDKVSIPMLKKWGSVRDEK